MVAQCLCWPWGAAPEAQRLQNACLSACQASNIDPNAMTAAYPGAVCLRITSSTATFALRLTDRARMRGMLPASSAPAGTGGIRYAIREQWTTTPHAGCRYVEGSWWCPAGSAGSNGHCIQYAGGTWCQFQAQTMSDRDYPLPTRHGVDGGLDRINANGATTFSANQEQREVCTERCSWRTDPDSGAQTYDCGQVCQPGWVHLRIELGVKRELKACHKVGAFCNSEVFGVCVEKRESFCCFNSPLARIMMTGSGSLLAAGGTRANAAVRAEQRASGIDAEAVRANAKGQLWAEARSSTPRPPPTNPPSP